MTRATVATTLNYHIPNGCTEINLGTAEMMRLEPDTHQVEIEDIRGHESEFNLDTHGFALYSHVSKYIPPEDESTIRNEIYAETAEMLKEM
jgi:hypothetical protein